MASRDKGPGMEKIPFLWEDQEPSEAQIERINTENLKRHANFRIAAEHVSRALSEIAAVRKIILFGSVAIPPFKEMPSSGRFAEKGVEVYHHCDDVDMAVWMDDVKCINELRTARVRGLSLLHKGEGIGVAHHQVDVFLLDCNTGKYLGRLCIFGRCPAKKYVCGVEGCGKTPFLRMHDGFVFDPGIFRGSETICLYDRRGNE
ncbi:MAG TPA: hypothetical protein VLM75_15145 [Spirochaetota bacterium]|nr:hypothetical protein [Spirochaetota bacterium]